MVAASKSASADDSARAVSFLLQVVSESTVVPSYWIILKPKPSKLLVPTQYEFTVCKFTFPQRFVRVQSKTKNFFCYSGDLYLYAKNYHQICSQWITSCSTWLMLKWSAVRVTFFDRSTMLLLNPRKHMAPEQGYLSFKIYQGPSANPLHLDYYFVSGTSWAQCISWNSVIPCCHCKYPWIYWLIVITCGHTASTWFLPS